MLLLFADLFKMVCEKGENVLDINIPVVMLPIDAGRSLEETVHSNSIGIPLLVCFQFYFTRDWSFS